jgi:sugar lactone lactonase YvrE
VNIRDPIARLLRATGIGSLCTVLIFAARAQDGPERNAKPDATGLAESVLEIPGERVFPESIASSADGTVFIGSLGTRTIFRAKRGAKRADVWIQPPLEPLQGIYGVFADDRGKTLWACVAGVGTAGVAAPAALHAYDLKTGKSRAQYPFPTTGASCNDIAVGRDGTVYVTDSRNMEILRLRQHGKELHVWAGGDGAFGPSDGILDGIAVLDNRVLVNTLRTGQLFSVPIKHDGTAGEIVEVELDRAIERPDGMRSFGESSLLLVESGGLGRLSRVDLTGDRGRLTTLQRGFPGGAVSVAVVDNDAYVLEGQLDAMTRHGGPPPTPFHALVFAVGKP